MLSTDVRTNGDKAYIVLAGRLDVRTAEDLKDTVGRLPDDVSSIDMDFSDVSYVSSAGIRELLIAARDCETRGGELRVIHPSDKALEPFGLSNLGLVLTIVE